MTALNVPVRSSRRLYGDGLAASFGAEAPALSIVTRSLPQSQLAVTELQVDEPAGRISDRLPCVDAYLISHELRSYRGMEYWENGRHLTYDLRAGDTTITDLRHEPRVKFEVPVHCMLWTVPCTALDALADDANVPRIRGLPHGPGVALLDETIGHLTLAARAAMRQPKRVNRLFVDYLTISFAAYVAETYGSLQTTATTTKGGLASWQERRAKEMLAADLKGTVTIDDVARACGLSANHFARAFRRSTGVAPHAWLLTARVERAMTLLRQPDLPLSEIALACGFADQSHFSRVFRRHTDQSPRDWRRRTIR